MLNIVPYFYYRLILLRKFPKRYANLYKIIFKNKCKKILEIGTYDGGRAYQMILTASIYHSISKIEYYGIDLFELMTAKECKAEFSKMPLSCIEVENKLEKTGADIKLYKGYSKEILKDNKNDFQNMDLIFIDGGHSIETITADWENIKELMTYKTIVIFDDYYANTENEVSMHGCQYLVNKLDKSIYEIEILEPMDEFVLNWGKLKINMVKVTLK